MQLALSVQDRNGTPAPQGSTLLASRPALVSTVSAGSPVGFQVDVTNTGSGSQQVSPAVVALGAAHLSDDTGSVSLGSASPTFLDDRGRPNAYQLHQFAVPDGADELNGDILWNAQAQDPQGTPGATVYETLWDPSGALAAYSLLAGAGRGHVEIRKPAAGTWTAAIFTVQDSTRYAGEVRFSYYTQRFVPAGQVSPASAVLAPGQTAAFTVSVASGQAGDSAASLRLSTGGAGDGSLPVLVRSLVPMTASGGTFDGSLTGGAAAAGQQLTYRFDVPGGQPVLALSLNLRDPRYPLYGFLVDPSGQPLDVQSTYTGTTSSGASSFGRALQFFEKTPAAGRWSLVLWLNQRQDAISPNSFAEPFSASIGFQPPPVASTGLPVSSSTVLRQGVPVTATVQVTNSGTTTKDFFVDPRLADKEFTEILSYANTGVPLPLSQASQPYFFVPPNSDLLYLAAQGTVPIVLETFPAFGAPGYMGTPLAGNQNIANASAPELAPNQWFAIPEAQGAFGGGGVGAASVDVGVAVDTNPFDGAVSSSSGDAWVQLTVDNGAAYTPLTLSPGQSGTIQVTITPTAPRGTVVRGFLELETYSSFTASGDEIAVLPYSYTVG